MFHRTAPLRTLEDMSSITTDTHAFAHEVLHVLSSCDDLCARDVDASIMAMMTVEYDTRFYAETLQSVMHQTILPGTIVIIDCSGRVSSALHTNITVELQPKNISGMIGHEPYEPTDENPHQSVHVVIMPLRSASSFGHAVDQALHQLMPCQGISALWLLHDDSRPDNAACLERLRDTWHNTPTASILGAKQVGWENNILHNVGRYAWHHQVQSLTVDGEPDQEQYDARGDVFAVSLAGALIPLKVWQTQHGVQPWMTTFGESRDFCRRICRSGGRVVVVPSARIAHRRARFEGIRTRTGLARSESTSHTHHGVASALRSRQRYYYTDINAICWPLIWLLSIPLSLFEALRLFFAKRPYTAWIRLLLPWIAIWQLPYALVARRRVALATRVSKNRIASLYADRHQILRWKERCRSFQTQQHYILLSPLARQHLRSRVLRRWTAAFVAAAVLFGTVLCLYAAPWREILTGAAWYGAQWPATGADFHQLAKVAFGSWIPDDGFALALPPNAWLMVWFIASAMVGGNPLLAVTLMFFLAAPAMMLSFWALAGVFTRSDMIRVCAGICWTMLAMAIGIFARGDIPMLMMMVFLPAAFAFAFHAVGMYVAEDPVRPVASVQCAALSALCFIPVIAAEPQLLLALCFVYLAAIIMVRSHRAMLTLIPIPSIIVCLPMLGSVVRYFRAGMWRQLFASMAVPLMQVNGVPRIDSYRAIILRAFNMHHVYSGALKFPWDAMRTIVMVSFASIALVMAVIALLLPFALRVSRMMWVVIVSGMALSLMAARIMIAADEFAPVSASILPGVVLSLLGILTCMCMVAGQAVIKFKPLRQSQTVPVSLGNQTRSARRAQMRQAAAIALRRIVRLSRMLLASGMLIMAVLLGVFALMNAPVTLHASAHGGLPMVVTDYLSKNEAHRVLALKARGEHDIELSVMRTSRGEAIDMSPALRLRRALYGYSVDETVVARSAAKLLAHADSAAIASLKQLGFGGIYIVHDYDHAIHMHKQHDEKLTPSDSTQRLIANINASEGTQLVVSAAQGTYLRFEGVFAQSPTLKTSMFTRARPLSWRIPWGCALGIVGLLYCLVAVPRFGYHHMLERSDSEREEDIDELV